MRTEFNVNIGPGSTWPGGPRARPGPDRPAHREDGGRIATGPGGPGSGRRFGAAVTDAPRPASARLGASRRPQTEAPVSGPSDRLRTVSPSDRLRTV
jgi:hypothetical protein